MRYQVTNNSRNPRAIFHGGKTTLAGVGETVTISMLKAEADNAVTDGLAIVRESDAENAEGGTRVFLAVGEDAQGGGMAPLGIAPDQFIGIAYGSEAPTDPRDYSWRPVMEAAASHPARAHDDTQTGEVTTGGETQAASGEDALSSEGGQDTVSGAESNDSGAGMGAEAAPEGAPALDATPPAEPLSAKRRGAGSYSIMQGEADVEVSERLTKAEAAEFNAMSDEDKAAWVELRTQG